MSDENQGPESLSSGECKGILDSYADLQAAIKRSSLVLSACVVCGEQTVCIPVFSDINKCRLCWEGKGK